MDVNYRREHFWHRLGTKRYFWLTDGIQRQPWTNHLLLLLTQTIPEVLAHKTCTENCAFWSSLRVINVLGYSMWNKDDSSVDQLEFPIWFHFNTLIYFLYIVMKELEITVIAKCQFPLLAFHFYSPISLVHFDIISSISLVNFAKLQARLVMECTDGVCNLWSQIS